MNPAEKLIAKLGGLTATAKLLSTDERGFSVSTVQGWKVRGHIPEKYWLRLIGAAGNVGITLLSEDFVREEVAVVFENSLGAGK